MKRLVVYRWPKELLLILVSGKEKRKLASVTRRATRRASLNGVKLPHSAYSSPLPRDILKARSTIPLRIVLLV